MVGQDMTMETEWTELQPDRKKRKQKNNIRMDESFDPLKCTEDLPSSPGCNMDYGKIL